MTKEWTSGDEDKEGQEAVNSLASQTASQMQYYRILEGG